MALPPRIVALSPGDLLPNDVPDFLLRASAALSAGLPGLMLREPALGDREFLSLARELSLRCAKHSAWFCVHDRVHVALETGASAVHLGFRSLPPSAARALLPAGIALGLSTHEGDEPARFAHCDYRIHGPVFDTPSKRGLQSPIGFEGVARALKLSPLPLLAIGGLQPEHQAKLRDLGAHGACARAAVFQRGDSPADTARRASAWLAALGSP